MVPYLALRGPGGVFGDVAAQLAALAARRVGRVEQADRLDGTLQVGGDDAGLGDRDEIPAVDLSNPVHALEGQHDAAGDCQGTAREARAGAARCHRDAAARARSAGSSGPRRWRPAGRLRPAGTGDPRSRRESTFRGARAPGGVLPDRGVRRGRRDRRRRAGRAALPGSRVEVREEHRRGAEEGEEAADVGGGGDERSSCRGRDRDSGGGGPAARRRRRSRRSSG